MVEKWRNFAFYVTPQLHIQLSQVKHTHPPRGSPLLLAPWEEGRWSESSQTI